MLVIALNVPVMLMLISMCRLEVEEVHEGRGCRKCE